jgi:Uma2 family endonuclease
VKHELLGGEIYAMAGGTPEHPALSAAVTTAIGMAVGHGPCRVFSSDLKVRVLATGLVTYPDVTVICGTIEHDPGSRVVATNPTLVVEVTSDATEDWDRGEKLEHFKRIPSLQECVLVSHRERPIAVWRRSPQGGWTETTAGAGETATLASIGCTLDVERLYRRALG